MSSNCCQHRFHTEIWPDSSRLITSLRILKCFVKQIFCISFISLILYIQCILNLIILILLFITHIMYDNHLSKCCNDLLTLCFQWIINHCCYRCQKINKVTSKIIYKILFLNLDSFYSKPIRFSLFAM